MTTVNIGNKAIQLKGQLPELNSEAPPIHLVDSRLKNRNWKNYADQACVIYSVASIETETCANTTKKLDQIAGDMPDYQFLTVSADLPFAQRRFAEDNNLRHVKLLSTFRDHTFGSRYGLEMENGGLAGLLTRSIMIVDTEKKIRYIELVKNISDEPDYQTLIEQLN
jgi:thiol peroxidase